MKLDINALITAKILNGGGPSVEVEPLSVTSNNTYTAPEGKAYSPVTVNVSGAGITKIAEKEFTVSTTSTSEIAVGTVDCGETAWNAHKLLVVVVKDKAGKRNGHFYCSNSAYINAPALIGAGSSDSPKFFRCIAVKDDGTLKASGTTNGVYDTAISNTGSLTIKAKYNSTNTLTIDGTYVVSVYLVDIDPFAGA